MTDELVTVVAEVLDQWIGDLSASREMAQAAIAATLDAVERNLSAVQYDPAPYTALKYRLRAMRGEG